MVAGIRKWVRFMPSKEEFKRLHLRWNLVTDFMWKVNEDSLSFLNMDSLHEKLLIFNEGLN